MDGAGGGLFGGPRAGTSWLTGVPNKALPDQSLCPKGRQACPPRGSGQGMAQSHVSCSAVWESRVCASLGQVFRDFAKVEVSSSVVSVDTLGIGFSQLV